MPSGIPPRIRSIRLLSCCAAVTLALLPVPAAPASAQAAADDGLVLVVALASSLPDVGSAASLVAAGVGDAVLFADSPMSLGDAAASLVQRYKPARFILIGGTAALATSIEVELAGLAPDATTERLAGADRLETAALAAWRAVGPYSVDPTSTVVLANGWSLVDVGVAASVVASDGADVVLYTAPAELGATASAALIELAPQSIVAVGGVAALPTAVLDAAVAAAGATSQRRLDGATRIETAAAGARFTAGACVAVAVVANGWSVADVGIAAALGAALDGSVVLYSQAPDSLGSATESEIERLEPAQFVTVGGDESLTAGLRTIIRESAPLTHIHGPAQATLHALEYANRGECEEEDFGDGGGDGGGPSASADSDGSNTSSGQDRDEPDGASPDQNENQGNDGNPDQNENQGNDPDPDPDQNEQRWAIPIPTPTPTTRAARQATKL